MEAYVLDPNPTAAAMAAAPSLTPRARSRKKKAPTLRERDWAPYKDQIINLYDSGMPLKRLKATVEAQTGFHAEYVCFHRRR